MEIEIHLNQAVSVTQKLLGEHIQKPVLAEKYLRKPPFRFLHEIFHSVIENTGFLKTTFASSELKYDAITTADGKRAFLKKAITAIEEQTGETCTARPSKILAGKEPDKTNELLQLLAKAIKLFRSKSTDKPAASLLKQTSKEKCNNNNNRVKSKNVAVKVSKAKEDKTGGADVLPKSSQVSKIPHKSVSKEDAHPERESKGLKRSDKTTLCDAGRDSSSQSKLKDKLAISYDKNVNDGVVGSGGMKVKSSTKIGPLVPLPNSRPSKESLKMNKDVLSTTVLQNKKSSTSLVKTRSKQSLIGKPSQSSLSLVTKRGTLEASKKLSSEEISRSRSKSNCKLRDSTTGGALEVVRPGECTTDDDTCKQESDGATNTTSSKHTMPPETTEEVPRRRPVTRTKYRENNDLSNDNDGTEEEKNSSDVERLTETEQISSQNPATKNSNQREGNMSMTQGGIGNEDKSISSDDGITERMNQKISEWSQEKSARQVAQELLVADMQSKSGWIPQSKVISHESNYSNNQNNNSNGRSSIDKVFKSKENLNSERDRGEAIIEHKKDTFLLSKRPITVIMDNENDDDEDASFLIQERIEPERDSTLDRLQSVLMSTASDMSHIPPDQRGLLVNQILETQRELEHLASQKTIVGDLQTELAERDREALREVYLKQIEELKAAIQKMAKSANPLANIMQRSQDDACLMEIEFTKLRQENERLQRNIDEAKAETLRTLCPLTEELAQLDSRIEKMEGAIVLAKQRLHIIDEDYYCNYIYPIGQCPTVDEEKVDHLKLEGNRDLIWGFAPGHGGDATSDEEGGRGAVPEVKSLVSVFQRAVSMHENEVNCGNCHSQSGHTRTQIPPPVWPRYDCEWEGKSEQIDASVGLQQIPGNIRTETRSCSKSRYNQQSLQQIQPQPSFGYSSEFKERPLAQEIKPLWWD